MQVTLALLYATNCTSLEEETAPRTSMTFTFSTPVRSSAEEAAPIHSIAETMEWSQVFVAGTSPASRSRHTCTLVRGSKLFIIGGGDESRVYNDLYVLDIGKSSLLYCPLPCTHPVTDTNTWSRPDIHGDVPTARWGHTCEVVGSQLVLFGGHDGTTMLNDLHVLSIDTMTWSTPQLGGAVPSPRAGHCISQCMGNLIVFGGGDGRR